MKKTTLKVSKREVAKVMKSFLKAIADSCGVNASHLSLTQGDQFCALIYTDPNILEFNYNLEQLLERGSNYYNGFGIVFSDMCKREKMAQGFSQITRVLLHEFGHTRTYQDVMSKYDEQQMNTLYSLAKSNNEYIKIPCEWEATQWALDWLKDAQHRKIAKEFERKFWACFD